MAECLLNLIHVSREQRSQKLTRPVYFEAVATEIIKAGEQEMK
jgi:hypothetical protein